MHRGEVRGSRGDKDEECIQIVASKCSLGNGVCCEWNSKEFKRRISSIVDARKATGRRLRSGHARWVYDLSSGPVRSSALGV